MIFPSLGDLEYSLPVPCPHPDEQRGVSEKREGQREEGRKLGREV